MSVVSNVLSDRKKLIGIISAGIILVAALVVGIILVNANLNGKEYTKNLELARKYYASMEYPQAIAAYKKANDAAPKEADAYIELATIYLEQSDRENAIKTLETGFNHSKSAKINLMLHQVLNGTIDVEVKLLDASALEDVSKVVRPNDQFLKTISTWTYADYKKKYGDTAVESSGSNGALNIDYPSQGIYTTYQNSTKNNKVVDESKGVPYETSIPTEIQLSGIDIIFNEFSGGVSYTRLEELFVGSISKSTATFGNDTENEIPVVVITYKDLVITVESDEDGNIVNARGHNKIVPLLATANKNPENTVSGRIENAVTGDGVAGKFTIYKDNRKVVDVESRSTGEYEVKLDEGSYVAKFQVNGFEEEEIKFKVDSPTAKIDFTISPSLAKDEIRIVLEWGSIPDDLDSHLLTPYGSEIWFGNSRATRDGKTIAELDLDDTTGYGPETTTIHNTEGTYKFSVYNYSRTKTFVGSNARVKVYLPGENPVIIDCTSSNAGNWWHVVEIDDGEIKIINEVSDNNGSFRRIS